MSRSFKHNPILKIKSDGDKKFANRKLRRVKNTTEMADYAAYKKEKGNEEIYEYKDRICWQDYYNFKKKQAEELAKFLNAEPEPVDKKAEYRKWRKNYFNK